MPHGDSLLQGKTGIARLVLKSRVPVLPIGVISHGEKHKIKNGEKASVWWQAVWRYVFKGQRTKLVIGRPLTFTKYGGQPISYELLREVTNEIIFEISKLSGKKITT